MSHSKKGRALVAMSGGVDSSVAAMLLKDEGYEVTGVSMNLLSCHRLETTTCCSAEDRRDAADVCRQLGVPHHVVDYRAEFKDKIIDPFVEEYLKGRTPSPCILCNEHMKFQMLFEEAVRLDADFVATGHYSRIVEDDLGFHLLKGRDESKDQSYFLFILGQRELSKLLFPVGGFSKQEVRDYASERGIRTHEKPESQEICFVPNDDYVSYIEEVAGDRIMGPGNFVDEEGCVLGRHAGIHAYTIGQRRGLGFGIGKRQYVIGIDPEKNEIVLGSDEALLEKAMLVKRIKWTGAAGKDVRSAEVKIRSTDSGSSAKLIAEGEDALKIVFDEPVRGIAPGQAAVFYDGDEVLGGGWIESVIG